MSFDLKTTVQPNIELSTPEKKLNCLIDQIEQLKRELAAWENAKSEIQSYSRKRFVPVYAELHEVLFKQLEQLWNSLSSYEFSKADVAQLDDKIYALAKMLHSSKMLSSNQLQKVDELYVFYQQNHSHNQSKKTKKKSVIENEQVVESENQYSDIENVEYDVDQFEDWDNEKFQREREEHQRKRLQQKREQAEKLAEQSLKTVYLKITAMIHPDREPDEAKKIEKTELQQVVNEAYEQQDLFYLLKLQLQLETNQGKSPKALTDEHLKFYKMALEAQSQRLARQIGDITNSFHWSEKPKPKNMQVKDVFKVIDSDVVILKEQVKWEKERLKFMGKVKGLVMLLGNNYLN